MEGVMMRGKTVMSVCVRDPQGAIVKKTEAYESIRRRNKLAALPVIRGIVAFVESMLSGYKTLMYSADVSGNSEEPSKFEKWAAEKFGVNVFTVMMYAAVVIAAGLAVLLFSVLPSALTSLIMKVLPLGPFASLIEGVLRMGIFIAYLWAISLMPDMRRVFEYHGAEHKTIHAFENGETLTPENCKKYSKHHPRCGTSFIVITFIAGILVFSVVTWENLLVRILLKLLLLPLVMGLCFELIQLAGRYSENPIMKAVSAPGLWIQRLTTREPDDMQLEVAIAALNEVLAVEASPAEAQTAADIESEPSSAAKFEQESSSAADNANNVDNGAERD